MGKTLKKILWSIQKWLSDVLGTREYFRYLEKEDRGRRLTGQFLTLITIAVGTYYLVWHWQHINWDAWCYSVAFFIAETGGLVLFSFFAFNAWFLRYHAPEGVTVERPFSVDVFIPVAGEPIELLRETVTAAVNIDYENKRVYILDDKGRTEYKELADSYGCGYFAREEHKDAKAGNLNYAFQRTEGDLILALDADQVPRPEIIKMLVGYFKIPRIAFVQSKQDFKVPVGDPFGNTDRIFYNVMQSGKDNDNAAFSCGSGVIYRREALQEIGGFSTWNIVEDVHTSLLLHDRGWRSVYYNHPLSKGTAPADIYGVYRQRRQWAADSLRIQFWDSPFRHKGLNLKQKLQYFNLGFVYLVSAFIMPLFFLTPILSLLTQEYILSAPVREYILHRAPYFITMSLAYGMINFPTPYMKAFQMWTGLFPAFIHATWIALCSRKEKPPYHVTHKPVGKLKFKIPWVAISPQLGITILGLFSIVYTFITGSIAWDFYLLNVLWIIWAIWTMSGVCLAVTKKHRWPKEGVLKEKRRISFLSKAKELIVTIAISIAVTLFFATVDTHSMDQFMSNLRHEVLQIAGSEKPAVEIAKEIPTVPKVSELAPTTSVEAPAKPALDQQRATAEIAKQPPNVPAVSEPAPKASVESPAKPTLDQQHVTKEETSREQWAIQVYSAPDQIQAEEYKKKLEAAGFPVYTMPAVVKGKSWTRVRVGFFKSINEAKEASDAIQRKGLIRKGPYWIVKASSRENEIHKVFIVSKPSPKNAIEAPAKPAPEQKHVAKKETSKEQWTIQVFSAPDEIQAEDYKKKLTAAGFQTYTVPAFVKGKLWIRVRVGFFKSTNEAKEVSDTIQTKGLIPGGPFWIMKVSSKEKEISLRNGN
ncbi:MAG: SPOR domain-containing protein [Syntrophales bacterium]